MMSESRAAAMGNLYGAGTVSAAGGTVFFGYALNELATIVGIVATLIGIVATIGMFALTWHYKAKHYRLAEERQARESAGVEGD